MKVQNPKIRIFENSIWRQTQIEVWKSIKVEKDSERSAMRYKMYYQTFQVYDWNMWYRIYTFLRSCYQDVVVYLVACTFESDSQNRIRFLLGEKQSHESWCISLLFSVFHDHVPYRNVDSCFLRLLITKRRCFILLSNLLNNTELWCQKAMQAKHCEMQQLIMS